MGKTTNVDGPRMSFYFAKSEFYVVLSLIMAAVKVVIRDRNGSESSRTVVKTGVGPCAMNYSNRKEIFRQVG